MPVMSTITSSRLATGGSRIARPGQVFFTQLGGGGITSPTWVVPQGVYRISGVLITGGYGGNAANAAGTLGGSGGRGGHLLYFNDLVVSPGETLSILVSTFGVAGTAINGRVGGLPGDTYIRRPNLTGITLFGSAVSSISGTVRQTAKFESFTTVGTTTNTFGGGGGGAAGYNGTGGVATGGRGGNSGNAGTAGTFGGGGGGAGGISDFTKGAGGGGTGFQGEGTSGVAGTGSTALTRIGGGGSGGSNGVGTAANGDGGFPGGGGGGGSTTAIEGGVGSNGVVRIIWGSGRSYPSTNTADV